MKTQKQNPEVANQLNELLADYQIYYQNLRGLHWLVKGRMFYSLHGMYETYYTEAADVIDEIAERILMLKGEPLHTFTDYIKVATLKAENKISDGEEGVKIVLENTQYLLRKFRDILTIASDSNDEGTAALLSELISSAEKRKWMLEATLA